MGNSIKLFISYSWTSQDHETWVLNLAKELVENGVHVVIDKWDLKEGQDSYSFMEKMVSDTEIQMDGKLEMAPYSAMYLKF